MDNITLVRWIAVPLGFVAGYLVSLVSLSLLRVAVGSVGGINPDALLGQFLAVPFSAAAGAIVAVYLGTVVAPSHKRQTTNALCLLVIVGAVLASVPVVLSHEQYVTWLGAGGTLFGTYATWEVLRFHDH